MQAEIDTALFDVLLNLEIGQPVILCCSTSSANILLAKNTEDGRVKAMPEAVHLREIPYLIQGKFRGVQHEEVCTYVLIETEGEAARFGVKDGRYCMVGNQTRLKLQSVPVGAINRIIQH